ncbi:hypothetical protein DPMN_038925 [Dreissena polymorpha]|uniref:Uncharacterized protein n=1 Tax=Dreissena polymorpha TaxID=45954 RepID=A0A9D4MHX7_DREPO|nr:hypothetical protein DPMN_038925 [Dreissena polymorpha]
MSCRNARKLVMRLVIKTKKGESQGPPFDEADLNLRNRETDVTAHGRVNVDNARSIGQDKVSKSKQYNRNTLKW